MEVYKYMTPHALERAKQQGTLKPGCIHGDLLPILALPDDPLVWGINDTLELLSWIQKRTKEAPEILVRWSIPLNITTVFVQEGRLEPWFKSDSRIPVSKYQRRGFMNPEVVAWRPIPIDKIQEVELPAVLKGKF